MATCSTSDLLADAACFTCLSTGVLQVLELQLLCEISSTLTGGGVGKEIFSGNGSPQGVVVPTVTDALYRQLDSLPVGLIWTWQGTGPWIAPET